MTDGVRSPWVLVRSSSRLTTAWVVARLPEDKSVITRSPGSSQIVIFLKVEILSSPALVRVSDIKTSPLSSIIPTQYVIRASLLGNVDRHVKNFARSTDPGSRYRSRVGIVQTCCDPHIARI